MKIFRHRGDIYVSGSGYRSSREERILIIGLIVVVVFTVVFLAVLGHKYSSVADFIAGDDVVVTEPEITDDLTLPSISGKTNFLIMETDDEQSAIHYAYLLQMDCDNLSYKVCTFDPEMTVNGKGLYDIFLTGGGALLQSEMTAYFGFDIDYYVVMKNSDMVEFINKLGNFIYPMNGKLRFKGGSDDDPYSLRLGDGEQNISGNDTVNLMRYYSSDGRNFASSNELVLYAVSSLFNEKNYDRAEMLFRLLISNSSTNITVRDYQQGRDAIMVYCLKNTDITVYSCVADYKSGELTAGSMQEIKGYFQ